MNKLVNTLSFVERKRKNENRSRKISLSGDRVNVGAEAKENRIVTSTPTKMY